MDNQSLKWQANSPSSPTPSSSPSTTPTTTTTPTTNPTTTPINPVMQAETTSIEEAVQRAAASYIGTVPFAVWKRNIDAFLNIKKNSIRKYIPSMEQYRALLTFSQRQVIDACPGSGKTTTMVSKVHLEGAIHQYKENDQLILTYTDSAAKDMGYKYRQELYTFNQVSNAEFSTIHALSASISRLLTPNVRILDPIKGISILHRDEELYRLAQEAGEDDDEMEVLEYSSYQEYEESRSYNKKIFITGREIIKKAVENCGLLRKYFQYLGELDKWISVIVERNIQTEDEFRSIPDFSELPEEICLQDIQKISNSAKQYRIEYKCIDFTDMLLNVYEYLKSLEQFPEPMDKLLASKVKRKAIYIDEFQDISPLQINIIEELLRLNPECRLFCVGDMDQAIYSFRGAEPAYLLNFKDLAMNRQQRVEVQYFTINRRSGAEIINTASSLISLNTIRYNKTMKPLADKESRVYISKPSSQKEAVEQIYQQLKCLSLEEQKETAVLTRENSNLRPLVTKLIYDRIPFQFKKEFLPTNLREYKDMIGILDFTFHTNNYYQVEKYVYKVIRGVTKEDAKALAQEVKKSNKPFTYFLKKTPNNQQDTDELRNLHRMIKKNEPMSKILTPLSNLYKRVFLAPFEKDYTNFYTACDYIQHFGVETYATYQQRQLTVNKWLEEYGDNMNGIKLLTMHRAKGLEFDKVYIYGIGAKYTPKEVLISKLKPAYRNNYIEEERRVLFVGMTRARKNLSLYFDTLPGRFYEELSRYYDQQFKQPTPEITNPAEQSIFQNPPQPSQPQQPQPLPNLRPAATPLRQVEQEPVPAPAPQPTPNYQDYISNQESQEQRQPVIATEHIKTISDELKSVLNNNTSSYFDFK